VLARRACVALSPISARVACCAEGAASRGARRVTIEQGGRLVSWDGDGKHWHARLGRRAETRFASRAHDVARTTYKVQKVFCTYNVQSAFGASTRRAARACLFNDHENVIARRIDTRPRDVYRYAAFPLATTKSSGQNARMRRRSAIYSRVRVLKLCLPFPFCSRARPRFSLCFQAFRQK